MIDDHIEVPVRRRRLNYSAFSGLQIGLFIRYYASYTLHCGTIWSLCKISFSARYSNNAPRRRSAAIEPTRGKETSLYTPVKDYFIGCLVSTRFNSLNEPQIINTTSKITPTTVVS